MKYMQTKSVFCENCETDVTVHADGSAYCSCNSREIGDGKSLPVSWEGDRESFRKYMRYISKT